MSGFALFGWLLAGWCGTVPFRRFPIPPRPEPDPEPWWRLPLGIAAGIAGGFVAARFGVPASQAALSLGTVLGTGVVAFAASVAVTDLGGRLAGRGAPARVGQVAGIGG